MQEVDLLSSQKSVLLNVVFLFSDHVPFRNSKTTRMLQPSLSGNARISVVCTINPDPGAIGESMSTLQFAKRIKSVHASTLCYFCNTRG